MYSPRARVRRAESSLALHMYFLGLQLSPE